MPLLDFASFCVSFTPMNFMADQRKDEYYFAHHVREIRNTWGRFWFQKRKIRPIHKSDIQRVKRYPFPWVSSLDPEHGFRSWSSDYGTSDHGRRQFKRSVVIWFCVRWIFLLFLSQLGRSLIDSLETTFIGLSFCCPKGLLFVPLHHFLFFLPIWQHIFKNPLK